MSTGAKPLYVPGSKVAIWGTVIPQLIGNPYNGYINPCNWVEDHPLPQENNGSLDPGTYKPNQHFGKCLQYHPAQQVFEQTFQSQLSPTFIQKLQSMEKILHHLLYMKPSEKWDIYSVYQLVNAGFVKHQQYHFFRLDQLHLHPSPKLWHLKMPGIATEGLTVRRSRFLNGSAKARREGTLKGPPPAVLRKKQKVESGKEGFLDDTHQKTLGIQHL